MNQSNIITKAKNIFTKNRQVLLGMLSSYDEKRRTAYFRKIFSLLTRCPYKVTPKLFEDTVEAIHKNKLSRLDPSWIGDFSFEIQVCLNPGVKRGLDWDKKLAMTCGGTARLLKVWISEAIPCFTYDTLYMQYSKKENFYEFGPIINLKARETTLIENIRRGLAGKGYHYVSPNFARNKFAGLFSDCRQDGGASIFDVLFTDLDFYQDITKRFVDKEYIDKTGVKIRWNEYYDSKHKLLHREEYRYYPSKNVHFVELDSEGVITKVKVWRNIGDRIHKEFVLDIEKEFKKIAHKEKQQSLMTQRVADNVHV